MLLHLSDISLEPLHAQISRQIRAKVLSGDLKEGDPLPSIRVMAKEQKVSAITVQRAYEDLDREGIIVSKRGKGFFVKEISDKRKQELAVDRLMENISPALDDAIAAGLSPDDIKKTIADLLRKRK